MAKSTGQIGQEVAGKLSAKTLGFDKPTIQRMVLNDQENDHFLYRVIGEATDLQPYTAETDDGETEGNALLGQFKITKNDGEVVEGFKLFLPTNIHGMVVAGVKGGNNVSIGMDIYARFDDKSATSYIYVTRLLIEGDRARIAELEKQIGNTPLPALPAPK